MAGISNAVIDNYGPKIDDFIAANQYDIPANVDEFAFDWKNNDWFVRCADYCDISVDYLRKILIARGLVKAKRKNRVSLAKSIHIAGLLIAEAEDTVLVLEHKHGRFEIIRAYSGDTFDVESNRLAAESFKAGYEYALRNNLGVSRQGE